GRLRDRVLLAVRAEALVELRADLGEGVAARAAALVAVARAARRAVVAGRDDAAVARDHRGHLALHAVAARRHHARDRHEVLVPARSFEKKGALQERLHLGLQLGDRAVVARRGVGEGLAGEQVLGGRVAAAELAPLERAQLLEGLRVAAAPARPHARQAHGLVGVHPPELEAARAPAQHLYLAGVAHGVDHV